MSINKQIRQLYYVYILIDPRNAKPFYVGKGIHARAYAHITEAKKEPIHWDNPYKCRKILKILKAGCKIKYEFKFCDTEQQALRLEKQLIKKYKRVCDGGILTNISEGGDQGCPILRPVSVYTKDGTFVKTYPSITKCAVDIGLASPNKLWSLLSKGGNKYLKSLKGYMFTYESDPPPKKYKHTQSKVVVIEYVDGNQLLFDTTSLAAKHLSVAPSTLRNWCNKNTKIPDNKNYKCYYKG